MSVCGFSVSTYQSMHERVRVCTHMILNAHAHARMPLVTILEAEIKKKEDSMFYRDHIL